MQIGGSISGIQPVSPEVGRDHLLNESLQTEVVLCDAFRLMDSLHHTHKKLVYLTGKRRLKANKSVLMASKT